MIINSEKRKPYIFLVCSCLRCFSWHCQTAPPGGCLPHTTVRHNKHQCFGKRFGIYWPLYFDLGLRNMTRTGILWLVVVVCLWVDQTNQLYRVPQKKLWSLKSSKWIIANIVQKHFWTKLTKTDPYNIPILKYNGVKFKKQIVRFFWKKISFYHSLNCYNYMYTTVKS